MSIQIRLTDQHLPVSPIFIDFLYQFLIKKSRNYSWHDQLSEDLKNEAEIILKNATNHLDEVSKLPAAQQTINRGYDLTLSLMFGAIERLQGLHSTNKFILVVGCPRSGGSYLTKHLFQALGHNTSNTPSIIAHDGFPDPVPFSMQNNNNAHTTLTRHMGEYIAMAELFFSQSRKNNGVIVIPKKATKAAYYGAFFNQALGPGTEIVLTIRHPVASCISTFEKSGGLPSGNRFAVRSNIENWINRDIQFISGQQNTEQLDYFECYLQYWENYHYMLVTSGLLANKNLKIVPFIGNKLYDTANQFYQRFENTEKVNIDEFRTRKKEAPQSDWLQKGNDAVNRVTEMWQSFGHVFPTDEILENY